MTPLDDLTINLRPGQWVVLTPKEDLTSYDMWGNKVSGKSSTRLPVKIMVISLPFVSVKGAGGVFAIDVREYEFTPVNRQFARSLLKPEQPQQPTAMTFMRNEWGDKPARKKKKKDENACPRCGAKLCQSMKQGERVWKPKCRDCGWNGDPVKAM